MKNGVEQFCRNVAGMPFHFVEKRQVLEVIAQWRAAGRREMIVVNNPHAVMLCWRDHEMREATLRAGLALPDGVGVVFAAAILGYGRKHRVTGPSVMLDICDRGRALGLRHFFYGGAEGVAERLAERMCELYPGMAIAGTYCPPFREMTAEEDQQVTALINGTRPDVVWVGLGAPKQEKWMLRHHGRLNAAATIGIGAAFDFHSGMVPWAPGWVRRCGLEWAHRLFVNPRRMWRRNIDSPRFIARVIGQAAGTALGVNKLTPSLPALNGLQAARPRQAERDLQIAKWCRSTIDVPARHRVKSEPARQIDTVDAGH